MAEEIVSAQHHHATSQQSYRPLFYIFSCARGRVVTGPGQHRRRRRRDGAVSYEPKLVGNTTAKDKWQDLMKWTPRGQSSRIGGNRVEPVPLVVESDVIVACSIIDFSIEVLQCSCSGWLTGYGKKLSNS